MQVYRAGNPLVEIEIDKRTTFSHKMHGEHIVTAVTVTEAPVGIEIGDYIEHKGQIFEVNQPIQTTKTGKFTYENTITFESYLYRLYNKVFMHQGAIEFAFLGTAQMYAQLIIDNMNEIDSGWTLGVIENTEDLPISFFAGAEGYSCRTALTLIAERFGLEYIVVNKTINLQKTAGRDTNYDFEVGMTKGLYSLTRKPLDDLKIINRIYPFGSTRNIPEGYRNGAKRLTIDGGYVERPLEAGEIRREGAIVLDDEYPNRTGTITAVSADGLTFTDPTLFDLNGQAIDGVKQQVVFKTGFLSGEEIDIAKYDNDTKEITLIPLVRENGSQVPDSTFSISVGDTYTLVGIKMPNLYVEQAEARLLARANEILSLPKNPTYELSIDEKYVRSNTILIELGDRINIRDEEMEIDTNIRVTFISYPIVNEYEITCQVSDEIPYTIVERVLKENSETKQEVVIVNRTNSERARRNWLDWKYLQTAVFDPDGYFDPVNIKPFTIETYMLSVGAKSQNFGLNNVVINPNSGGNPNTLSVSAGELIHYEVQIEGVGYIWTMAQRTFTLLDPVKHYYLFARCSKSNLNGTWEISDVPVMTNDPTYPDSWNFLLGIIHPVVDGYRNHSLTNGMTLIVGDTITTGRIKSLDGLNYFDLTANRFKLGGDSYGIDWNVTRAGRLTIRGGIFQSRNGTIDYPRVDQGAWNNSGQYYLGDVVKYGGTWYQYINASAQGVSGGQPNENPSYWKVTADKGDQGAKGDKGDKGDNGANGARGASLVGRGIWSNSAQYRGNGTEVSAVEYLGVWYNAKKDVGLIPIGTAPKIDATPENPDPYWEEFGAQFESVATGLLLAQLAYITNLGVRFLQTDVPGNKRVEINGDDNNIRIMASNNKRYIELDDDTAKSITSGMFYIQFSTGNMPSPNIIAVDPLGGNPKDHPTSPGWSQYNTGSIDSRTGLQGNWSNGFPLGYSGLFDAVSGGRRYYFYNTSSGIMLQNPFESGDPINPITSISHDSIIVKNLMLLGMNGNGSSRIIESFDNLDSSSMPDSVLLYEDNSAGTFTFPNIMSGANYNYLAGKSNVYGRVVEIVNNSTNNLTVESSGQTGMFRYKKDSINSYIINVGESVRFKLISLQSQPVFPQNWRWQIISRSSI